MDNVNAYKCPQCGAPLAFDPASQQVKCAHCGGEFSVEAVQAFHRAESDGQAFDWGEYKQGLSQETLDNTVVYRCQSCGAEIETDANTAATKCPYCDNNVVLTDRVKGGLKPNAVIPFKITPKELPGVIEKFYKGKKLLPKGFFSANKIGKVQGVYIPFWLFDCKLDGTMMLDAENFLTYDEGDYIVHETQHYLLERDGSMAFAHVPVDASVKMDNDLMDSVEPYDFSELVPFDGAYLSGYLADRFDSGPDDELPRAEDRMQTSAETVVKNTSPFGTVSMRSNNMDIRGASVKYAMLPVYLLNCEYGGKKYRYAVNGQTGKVVGELPVSGSKSFAWFAGVFLAVAGLITALGLLLT